jgi:FAD/FMN-containing dehydrogenase
MHEPSNGDVQISIPELRSAVSGRVIAPGDDGYDEARTPFYGGFDRRPAAIVRVASASDVAAVVDLARETDVELAVRSGGHSIAGHCVTDGGIVLDLADLNALEIDAEARTAWGETGLTAGAYTAAAGEQGLATGFGDTGSVGIGGITLGGGVGYLVRKHGLTIDDLLAAEVVTADGELVRTDAETHPDLFWAIRGGGGNFGVATRFRYRLHELDSIVGGLLLLPATPETIVGFVAEADAAPEELSTIANVMPAPPMPFVPEEHHGRLTLLALMCFAGEQDAAEAAMAPFRGLAPPIADLIRPMPYAEMYQPDEEGFHPLGAVRNLFVDGVDGAAAGAIVEHLQGSTAMMSVTQLRVLGGAMARVPAEATAFAHRDRRIMVNVATLFESPDERPTHEAWVDALASAIRNGAPGAYVGFLGDEGEARVREAYPAATWDRLAEVKARYDPTNLFRFNQNVPPAAG